MWGITTSGISDLPATGFDRWPMPNDALISSLPTTAHSEEGAVHSDCATATSGHKAATTSRGITVRRMLCTVKSLHSSMENRKSDRRRLWQANRGPTVEPLYRTVTQTYGKRLNLQARAPELRRLYKCTTDC